MFRFVKKITRRKKKKKSHLASKKNYQIINKSFNQQRLSHTAVKEDGSGDIQQELQMQKRKVRSISSFLHFEMADPVVQRPFQRQTTPCHTPMQAGMK